MHWYAVYTNPRAEKKLYDQLQKLGTEAYLPLLRKRKKWSDRYKWVEEPAFPSYVFVRLKGEDRGDFLRILRLPHAVRFVSHEGEAAHIPDADMELLQLTIAHYAESLVVAHLSDILVGERVRITEGAFMGREAVVDAKEGKATVIVAFPAIHQTLRVAIPLMHIQREANLT